MAAVLPAVIHMPEPEFSGRRVLVTGSTGGIGRAAAELIASRGAEVIWHGRAHADAEGAARAAGGSLAVAGDLADRAACRRIVAETGEVDALVNCAASFEEASISNTDEATWDRTIAVNLTAAWTLARALLPGLRRRRGVVVNVASAAAVLGYPNSAAYCASHGALVGLTKALAVELAPDVRAISVCPGPVRPRHGSHSAGKPGAVPDTWAESSMLGRLAEPQEIAEIIAFAASRRASYMTGNVMVVDGGAAAGRRVAL